MGLRGLVAGDVVDGAALSDGIAGVIRSRNIAAFANVDCVTGIEAAQSVAQFVAVFLGAVHEQMDVRCTALRVSVPYPYCSPWKAPAASQ